MENLNVFFDIETARQYENLHKSPEAYQQAWNRASYSRWPSTSPIDTYQTKASLYPEFSRIVCISVKSERGQIYTFYNEIEKDLILRFNEIVVGLNDQYELRLIGHNIKRFDIPFINTRSVVNNIGLNSVFKTYGYERPYYSFIDTLEIWKGGADSTSQISSLEAICLSLGVDSPKDGIQGKDVPNLYHSGDERVIEKICRYCEKDVIALERCFKAMVQLNML